MAGARSSVFTPSLRTLRLGPPLSSVLFASVAGVASLLCVNSALIQKLFYAVKRTRDRQRGVEGGEEGGMKESQGNISELLVPRQCSNLLHQSSLNTYF